MTTTKKSIKKTIQKNIERHAQTAKKHASTAGKQVKKGTIQLRNKTVHLSKGVNKKVSKMNSKKISKSIDKNIAKTNRLWDNISVVTFNKESLKNLSHYSGFGLAFFSMFFTALVLVFPTRMADLDFASILINLVMVFGLLIISVSAMWGVARILRSKIRFRPFFFVVNTSIFLSLLTFTIPITLVAFAIFATMLQSADAISMFFTFLPFYNYLVWGWSAETVANLKGIKSIVFGVLCLLWIMLLHLGLQYIMI